MQLVRLSTVPRPPRTPAAATADVDGVPDRRLPRATYLVKQLEWAVRAHLDDIMRSFNLTTLQYTALSVLARHPGMSAAQLARRSFVSSQAANEMVSALERKGLVERGVDETNRRALKVFLTREGADVLDRCDAHVDQLEREMFAGVTAAKEAQFRLVLRSCLDAVNAAGS
jgi:DNA-binding MarR family transcriptional regulator